MADERRLDVPPPEAFLPTTLVVVLLVLSIARPESLSELEEEARRVVGADASRAQLCLWCVVALVVAVAVTRGGFYLVALAKLKSREWRERQELLARERAACLSLFSQLNGDGWTDKTGWGTSAPLHTWKGVFINHSSGRIVKLCLPANKLACDNFAEAGAALGQLAHLEELDLRANALRGALPTELCSLKRMQGLYLYDNYFSGKCPPELITNLRHSLRGIYLFNNNFEDVEATRALCGKVLHQECLVYV